MNKKIWILVLIFAFLIFLDTNKVNAESEQSGYTEVIMQEGKLLDNFTDAEYDEYYKKIEGNRFWGWKIYEVNKNVPCTYIKNTVFETVNNGTEPLTYEIDITTEQEVRTILNASGSISYKLDGKKKVFKHNLAAEVSLDYKYQNTESKKRTEKIKMPIEGKTKLLITIEGTGYVTNGVGAYFICWFENQKGGFEYFTITNEFQKVEKVAYV